MANGNLFARSVYKRWCRNVREARASVVVLTPFLDNTLVRVLSHANVERSQIVVVTSLSADADGVSVSKIRSLIKLVKNGVQVRDLSGLHAKVLMTDDKNIVLGSQNFTGAGRKNHEVSIDAGVIDDDDFLERVQEWVESAEEVSLELLERLLPRVVPIARDLKRLSKKASEVLEEARAEIEAARVEESLFTLVGARSKLAWIDDRGPYREYECLMPDYSPLELLTDN